MGELSAPGGRAAVVPGSTPRRRSLAFVLGLEALSAACRTEQCDPNVTPQRRDPLECVAPLPALRSDGTAWPSYSDKRAELEACRDGALSLAGALSVTASDCADGKKLLSVNGGFSGTSYYYRDETLVGYESWSDVIFIDCSGCTLNPPLGTREDVTCEAVASTDFHCQAPPDARAP